LKKIFTQTLPVRMQRFPAFALDSDRVSSCLQVGPEIMVADSWPLSEEGSDPSSTPSDRQNTTRQAAACYPIIRAQASTSNLNVLSLEQRLLTTICKRQEQAMCCCRLLFSPRMILSRSPRGLSPYWIVSAFHSSIIWTTIPNPWALKLLYYLARLQILQSKPLVASPT
jgi:hypothetical protein